MVTFAPTLHHIWVSISQECLAKSVHSHWGFQALISPCHSLVPVWVKIAPDCVQELLNRQRAVPIRVKGVKKCLQILILNPDLKIAAGFRELWQAQCVRLIIIHNFEGALKAHDTSRASQLEPIPKLTHHDLYFLLLLLRRLVAPAASPVLLLLSLDRIAFFALEVRAELSVVNLAFAAFIIKLEYELYVRVGCLVGEHDSDLGNRALKLIERDGASVHDVKKLECFLQKH